ncbi:MAG TPA: TonB family protein [Anaeromyxobacter sp.]|nr:TonB family protein [Anaeromyxobacter sp.]
MAFLGPSLRRKRVVDRPGRRVLAAAGVSLALNALLLALLTRLGAFELPTSVSPPTQVALAPLTADEWNANRLLQAPAPRALPAPSQPAPPAAIPSPAVPPPPKPAAPPPEEKRPRGQVVDVAPSKDSRPPENSRFLSDRDNRVEKETRSRWAGTRVFENRAPAPVQGHEGKPAEEHGQGGTAREERQAKAGAGGAAGNDRPAQAAESKAPSPTETGDELAMLEKPPSLPGPSSRPQQRVQPDEGLGKSGAPGEAQEEERKAGDPRLLPSVDSMSRITAGPSNDYIDRDIPEGEETALNTRAFKYATFWNRFKQEVSGHWHPALVYSERDPQGTMFGNRPERATALHLVLDSSGAVKEIKVVESSGLDFLDREAVRAVQAAAPYYNIPQGLLDEKGELAFSFGMILIMDRAIPVRPHF